MIYLQLFWEFFKTGLFAVGGGIATLPFLYDISDRFMWFDRGQLADMVAISESTPGPIGVNMSTYAGFHTAGILGALVATVGLVLPSVIIIILIAKFMSHFSENPLVRSAFYGLRPAVAAMITMAGVEVAKISLLTLAQYLETRRFADLFDLRALSLFFVLAVAAFLLRKKNIHPVVYIAASAAVGILFKL